MTEKRYPLFVYGSLRPREANYRAILAGHTANERDGRLPDGDLYMGRAYPFVVLGGDDPTGIIGKIVDIKEDSYADIIEQLDHLEAYDPKNVEDSLYVRKLHEVSVLDADGNVVEALEAYVYVASEATAQKARAELPRSRTGDWGARPMA